MSDFAQLGRVWLRGGLLDDDIDNLLVETDASSGPGRRIELTEGLSRALSATAASETIQEIWPGMAPVRAVLFDKSGSANWGVPWHQDRVIAVQNRVDVPGFRNWSRKAGTWHCEPPLALLRAMLFVRIHLDACTKETGAMEIALGSHSRGLVTSDFADEIATACPTEVTEAEAGDVLILSMLTLHRSRPASTPARRRVLRVDYASQKLPAPLEWAS